MTAIAVRAAPEDARLALQAQGLPPLFSRLFAARGVARAEQLDYSLKRLLPYHTLKDIGPAAVRLADAIARQERLLVVADYDADGATACALAVRGLRRLGGVVEFIVPNRFEYGYGLTPEIVELAAQRRPDLLITVDNGVASVAGVQAARRHGMDVLITDHHLAGDELPDALIVNPNQPGCQFPSKHLAGVGVMFYVLMALRAELRQRGAFAHGDEPNLADWLDLVALGTVADVVKLDDNNRILVEQGLRRMRAGRACAGVNALFAASGRQARRASTVDLGFMLGPRLNAAGRLDDMSLGIACLLADDGAHALALAGELDRLNKERRHIEAGMQEEALAHLAGVDPQGRSTLCLYREDWHQGVVGIVASQLKDRFHRPTLVFAPGDEGEVKGSGRSIPGFHLRDALDRVAKQQPDLLRKFGGHAMAAGVTLAEADLPRFIAAFEAVAQDWLTPAQLTRTIETDGSLAVRDIAMGTADQLAAQVWGQGFPPPSFHDQFRVLDQRRVGERHLKLKLGRDGGEFDAMLFNCPDWLPARVDVVYQLNVNEWRGERNLQLMVDNWQPAA